LPDIQCDSLRAVIDASRHGYWDWVDPSQQNQIWLSSRYYDLLGYKSGEFPPTISWLSQAIHPDDRDRVWTSIDRHLKHKQTFDIEYRIKTKEGEYRWVLARGQASWDEENRPTRMSGTIEDVTDRKIYQDAISHLISGTASHTGISYLESLVLEICKLFDVDYALIALLDDDNQQRLHTIAVCAQNQITGNMSYDLAGTPCAEVIGASPCTFRSHIQEKFPKDALLRQMEVESYIGIPLFASDGNALGAMALLNKRRMPNDLFITEIAQLFADRAAAEIERIQSESELQLHRQHLEDLVEFRTNELNRVIKELESFSYSVSHDLRAPLRAINGYSNALSEDCDEQLDDIAKDHLNRIRSAAKRMERLIDDLLALSRVTRHQIKRSRVNLSVLSREILEQLQTGYPQRNVIVNIQPDIVASGDPNLIRIVLENLIGNAWKYTGKIDPARIEISMHAGGEENVYQIQDNGTGFNMDYAKKLFEVFQRLHRTEDFEGTGVGLATVKRIIERHGGSIWAESREGDGARFYFTLPVQKIIPAAVVTSG